MKKKLLIFTLLCICVLGFSACGKKDLNLADYIIEERNNLFVATDELYSLSLSSGLRESDYNLDGIITDKVDFAVLTFVRNDNLPLANDTYAYKVNIGETEHTGFLEKSPVDNTYVADLGVAISNDACISAQVSFTGYTFSGEFTNISDSFAIDKNKVIEIANNELGEQVKNILSDPNVKIEVVTKIMKDFSSVDVKNYYWYLGVISTNGDTLGVLIDANSGDIIAKKV